MHAAKRVAARLVAVGLLSFGLMQGAAAQSPVFVPPLEIDQTKLLTGCPLATDPTCAYPFKDVLNSGGDFWTTPFTPYDPATKSGDGYGEGVNGPRADQRKAFSPVAQQPPYRFLRMNGLDSQSCFECHNSIGSAPVDARGALSRKQGTVGGSAGSNSNAFINPLFPTRLTLFIRNPPAVFGSGYQQAVSEEMTIELLIQRDSARAMAKRAPGKPFSQPLSAKGVGFGTFTTTYVAGSPAKVLVDATICQAGLSHPESIGGAAGYTDDLRKLEGVSCDLVIRPFQWKGVSSSLRHFVRDALDFHFSMQAFEKVGQCDCDRDGKGTPATGPEVTLGNLTAITSFVSMTRAPVQDPVTTPSQQRGQEIFFGKAPGSYQNMCADCHVGPLMLKTPNALIEWPTTSQAGGPFIDPAKPDTWPVTDKQCPGGIPPSGQNACPVESSYSAQTKVATVSRFNRGALVSPVASSQQLAVVRRYNQNLARPGAQAIDATTLSDTANVTAKVASLRKALTGAPGSIVGQDYVVPLNPDAASVTPLQLPRLPSKADGSVDVPLFSDLKRHDMGSNLTDPPPPAPSQGTDVVDINTRPREYMTRPLWGVADTGPWLHDGRAMTLKEAILMHGDRSTGSEAGPVVEAFQHLSAADQDAVVSFLLTLHLPLPGGP